MLRRLVAIDGGGTKTELALFDELGRVESRVVESGCNPNDFGWDHTQDQLRLGLDRLLKRLGGRSAAVDAVFAGVSGATVGNNRQRMAALLGELLPRACRAACDSDAVNALSSGIGTKDGCVVISGTGSVGFVRVGKTFSRVGGWGYLFDRGGSGYDLGRDAVYRALCAADGRGPATRLTPLLENALGESLPEAVPGLYKKGKPAIAALAPLVFEALRQGDRIADGILRENGRELAKLINVLCERAGGEPCQIVLTGSVFQAWEQLSGYVTPLLVRPHRLVFPTLPPIYGSAVEAAALLGLPADDAFERRFALTLSALKRRS